MPIISTIGRRHWKVRLLLGGIYAALIAGALSMVYPFLLMIAGSSKSAVDVAENRLVPRFLVDDQALYRKYTESLFNEQLSLMQAVYDSDAASFGTLAAPDPVPDAMLDAWADFLRTPSCPRPPIPSVSCARPPPGACSRSTCGAGRTSCSRAAAGAWMSSTANWARPSSTGIWWISGRRIFIYGAPTRARDPSTTPSATSRPASPWPIASISAWRDSIATTSSRTATRATWTPTTRAMARRIPRGTRSGWTSVIPPIRPAPTRSAPTGKPSCGSS